MVCTPPGSSVHRISQTIREWVAISSSSGSFRPRDRTSVSSIGRWILYHWATRKAFTYNTLKHTKTAIWFCSCSSSGQETQFPAYWFPTHSFQTLCCTAVLCWMSAVYPFPDAYLTPRTWHDPSDVVWPACSKMEFFFPMIAQFYFSICNLDFLSSHQMILLTKMST